MEIWFVERAGNSWSVPQKIDFGGVSGGFGTYPSVAASGNLYFNGRVGSANSAICVSRFENGRYHSPEELGPAVNSEAAEHHPFIAPDESYILFDSQREEDSFGNSDIFISRRQNDGTWSEAKNLGPKVNSSYMEMSSFVSADGNYLFFSSSRPIADLLPVGPLDFEEINRRLNGPGNGLQDIYWVSTKAIQLP